jgi:prolyl-tRNA synthetase
MYRLSTTFLRTLRDDPADAEVPSHRLLVRAGYIRRAAPGGYTWLPLGWAVYRRVEEIVREEMNAIGAQEVHFPAMLPREPYEATNRWTEYGDNLFRLKDRRGVDYLLGPTHEEMFTLLVKDLYSSYKDLPVSLYQIQTKYRDEARPRAGLLRGREFSMKDSYSFDLDQDGLEKSYQAHRGAYIKIFDRLGLPYVIVSAMAGAMGGSLSEEFLAECEVGEDTFVRCSKCDYAANTEAVKSNINAVDTGQYPAAATIDTPDSPTIDALVDFLNKHHNDKAPKGGWTAAHTLKNVVVNVAHPDGTKSPLVIGVPGDREVDLKRVEAQLSPLEIEPFTEEDFAKHPKLVRGYIGAEILGTDSESGIRYVLDPRVANGTSWVTGANEFGKHRINVVAGRDFTPDQLVDAVEVHAGDPCPECGKDLRIDRGIEIGHVFQLGKKYAEALDLKVLDQNGKTQVVTMGSYGIGVSRVVAAIAEATHDEIGLCWPRNIAPADVHVVTTGKNGDDLFLAAEKFATELESRGLTVIFDDRNGVSPGVKFKDAELLGMPVIAVIGKKFDSGHIEVRERKSGIQHEVPIEDAINTVVSISKGH